VKTPAPDAGAPAVERLAPASCGVHADKSVPDIVDVWGRDSFPASDAPANW
jgi:hypothetical protein